MFRLNLIIVSLMLALFYQKALAVFEPKNYGSGNLGQHLEYFEDKAGTLSLDDIRNLDDNHFFKGSDHSIVLGLTSSVYWIRFSGNFSDYSEPYWYFVQDYEHISYLTFYYFDEISNEYKKIESGNGLNPAERLYNTRNFILKIPSPDQNSVVYYIRCDSAGKRMQLDFRWKSEKALIDSTELTSFIFGLFYGGLVILLLYNAFLGIFTKDITYLYYVFHVASILVLYVFLNGYTASYLQISSSYNNLFTTAFFTTPLASILFSRHFLKTKETLPRADIFLRFIQYTLFVLAFLSYYILSEPQSVILSVLVNFIVPPSLIGIGIYRFHQGFDSAKLYIAGWVVFNVFIILYTLQAVSILPSSAFINYGIQIGTLWEGLLFSFALAQRTNQIQRDRDRALIETTISRKTSLNISQALENDRKRISHEVHDNFNATLVLVKQYLKRIMDLSKGKENDVYDIAASSYSLVDEKYKAARLFVRELRPETLDVVGLESALDELISHYNESSDRCVFYCTIDDSENTAHYNEYIKLNIYRVVQEGITNTAKHAEATEVFIHIICKPDAVHIKIEDNGVGFKVTPNSEGFGLNSIRDRCLALSGTFDIDSVVGKGTVLMVSFPISV